MPGLKATPSSPARKKLGDAEELLAFVDTLSSLTSRFSEIRTGSDLADELVRSLADVMDVPYVGVYLWDPSSERLELLRAEGFTAGEQAAAQATAWKRHPGAVFRSMEELLVADTAVDHRTQSSRRSFTVRSRLYIPILRDQTPLGTLGLAHTTAHAFTQRHRTLLRFFARLGGVVYGQICDRDERQRAVEALALANADLEAARDDAMQATRTKSEFLATMSHELRTPLSGIIGYTELARDLIEDGEGSQAGEDLGVVLRSARNLLAIINDILDLSKIEAGKLELASEHVPLDAVVDDVLDELEPVARAKNNHLRSSCSSDAIALGDRDAVRRILVNLVGNALKFTDQGRVTVRATRRGDRVLMAVSDTGIGMTPDQLEKVFESFAQAEAGTRRRFGGTGLGLTITRHLAAAMHGAICAESSFGSGSTFHVDLPAA